MTNLFYSWPRLVSNNSGATITEFALIFPVFAGMICGFLEFAQWAYVKAATTGAIEQVARSAGVGGAAVVPAVFEAKVETLVKKISKNATFVWDPKSYYQFSGIDKPEKLTSDQDGDGNYDAGDCWQDLNPNLVYDATPGQAGVGGADDIVFYKVTVSFTPLIPISGFFPGVPTTRTVNASTIVKRQPYAAQTVPAIRC